MELIKTSVITTRKRCAIVALVASALLSCITLSCGKTKDNSQRTHKLLRADSVMEEAYQCYDNADFSKSIELSRRVLPIYSASHDSAGMSDVFSHLSACYHRISMTDSALSNGFAGLRIDEKLNDKERLSSSYNNLAGIFVGCERPEEAKAFIVKAISIENEITPARPTSLAIRYGIAAEVYLKLNKSDTALTYINKAFEIDSVAADTVHMARRLAVMGDTYNAMNNPSKALECYNRSLNFLEITGDKYSQMLTYKNLGSLHDKQGNTAEAIKCLEQSAQLAKECNAKRVLQQDYVLMAGVLRDSDPRQALELMRQSNDLKDSIFNDASSKLSAQYAMEFESKQKQLTIEEQQHSLTTQRLIIIATSIAVLLLLVGCVALFLINWLRSKAQRAEKNAEQMKDLFFTNVTHEFRTPLTVILGEAESLRIADKTPSNQPRYNAIINQGNHLLDLVNQLLHMSKVRTSMGSLQWQNGDISTMVNMIVENMRVLAENRNITITTTFDNSDFNIDFVPEYCHSIVTNLIGNSLKFTPNGGQVDIAMSSSRNVVTIKISDNGCGIKSKDLPHIFDLFYQGDSEKADLGTGIGLSIVKLMTETMNGSIQVESEEDHGTTFTIMMPAKQNNVDYPKWIPKVITKSLDDTNHTTHTSSNAIEQGNCYDDNSNKPIALIVEDNADVALFIEHVMEEQYNVVHAYDGHAGLSKAREIVPDIIITDVMMPEINGYELCKMIRSDELINHVPIVIVTARDTGRDRLDALAAGADAFLVKPFNNDELLALAENLLLSRKMLRMKFKLTGFDQTGSPSMQEAPATPSLNTATIVEQRNRAFIDKVKSIIHDNIDNSDMSSLFIADKMNLSQRQLNRKIKSIINADTTSLIRDVRITVAKEMLITSQDPVTEIAERCGFESSSYFSKIFKQYTKLTPTDFRKQILQ